MSSAETTLSTQSPIHSMALAWTVIWMFGVAGLMLLGLVFGVAIHFFFGG